MIIKFVGVDSEGNSRLEAVVKVDQNGSEWSGPDAESVKNFVMREIRVNGKNFDPANLEHWRYLPSTIRSYRFWCAIEDDDQNSVIKLLEKAKKVGFDWQPNNDNFVSKIDDASMFLARMLGKKWQVTLVQNNNVFELRSYANDKTDAAKILVEKFEKLLQ